MKIRKIDTSNDTTITNKIYEFENVCPFPNLKEFYDENKGLVKKFLRKDTMGITVDDWNFEEVPEHWWYQNKEGLLRHGIKKNEKKFTVKQKLEWIKCALDVVYFTRKYVKIISIDDGIIPFDLWDFQEDLLDLYQNNRFIISMQSRQTGKTQTTASYLLWFSIFSEAKTSAILANKSSQAQEILERVQLSYESIPCFLQPGVKVYNKQSVVFSNNSKAFSAASSSSSIRGKSIALLYIDEAAFIPNDMAFYESTYPTIASGKNSKVIVTSTPNGTRGMFYKLWQESEAGKNSYAQKLVTWDMVPGRDQAWKEETINNTSPEQFRQEHECHFRGSTNSLISGNYLEQLITKEPLEELNEGKLFIYHKPIEGHEYVCLVDCSEGVGGDYHGVIVVDISVDPYEVVCVYHDNKLSSLILPELIYNVAGEYNAAWVLIENESTGHQVSSDLYHDLEYENVIFTVAEKGQQSPTFRVDGRIGVKMSKSVKRIGCANLKTMIERGRFNPNHMNIVDELGDFVPKGGSYAAAEGAHDDLVMPLVMFAWLSNSEFFKELTDVNVRSSLVDQAKKEREEELMPFGIIDDGRSLFDGDSFMELGEDVDPDVGYRIIEDPTFGEF
tara:strand:- start:119552 stop:121396 length:1845 start_codon:yes stop_codon:yes gene_type:complete